MIELNSHLARHLPPDRAFETLLALSGRVHRQVKGRRTLDFQLGDRHYFIKIHQGCGWREIVKNLLMGKRPILSAENEWRAIERLHEVGVPTLTIAGKGLRGTNPAALESFLVTEALEGMISLEQLTADWRGLTGMRRVALKRVLLAQVAKIAGTLHEHGMNHRDFYLCHFLVEDRDWGKWMPADPLQVYLIDLHRVQIRSRVPERWRLKDLAGLLFSALDAGLTKRDLLRFVAAYRQRPWRSVLAEEGPFWRRVGKKAHQLYVPFHGRRPALLLEH